LTVIPEGLRRLQDLRRQRRHPAVDRDMVLDVAITAAAEQHP
jgi:hypothetical protein